MVLYLAMHFGVKSEKFTFPPKTRQSCQPRTFQTDSKLQQQEILEVFKILHPRLSFHPQDLEVFKMLYCRIKIELLHFVSITFKVKISVQKFIEEKLIYTKLKF